MHIRTFYFNPIRVSTYVLYDDSDSAAALGVPHSSDAALSVPRSAVLIDVGCFTQQEQQRLARFIEQEHLVPVAHLLTHAHLDHLFGAAFVQEQYRLTPMLHPQDKLLYTSLIEQAQAFGIPWDEPAPPSFVPLSDGQELDFGFCRLRVIHTPGHSPGSVCFYDEQHHLLFSGDTLFQHGYGRTDLPGGDPSQLYRSLQHLFTLPPDTQVWPGHGLTTTISDEQND